EACSLAVIEAMAVGLPLITTPVGGTPWIITHKKHGLLVGPRKPGALAQAIQWAGEHPAEMGLMGRWAHKKALKRYHWDRVVVDYRKLLARLRPAGAARRAGRRAG
ncbi:MAG: glycosyltransferase, partial [Planctomycetota bacterium]